MPILSSLPGLPEDSWVRKRHPPITTKARATLRFVVRLVKEIGRPIGVYSAKDASQARVITET
jgi:hypothetical protein